MQSNWKHKIIVYLKKSLVPLGITLLFALFSLYPRLAYNGEAQINNVYRNFQLLYQDVDITCNVTFNPFLFPLSWLTGRGQVSQRFLMRTVPKAVTQFTIVWPSPEEIKDDALLIVTLNSLFINIPYNFVIFLAIEIIKLRIIYFFFFAGIIGFLVGSLTGALVGSLIGLIIIFLLKEVLNKKLHIESVIFTY